MKQTSGFHHPFIRSMLLLAVVFSLASLPFVFAQHSPLPFVINGTDGMDVQSDPVFQFHPTQELPQQATGVKISIDEFDQWSAFTQERVGTITVRRDAVCAAQGIEGNYCFVHGRIYTLRLTVVDEQHRVIEGIEQTTRRFRAITALHIKSSPLTPVESGEPFTIQWRASTTDPSVSCALHEPNATSSSNPTTVTVPLVPGERVYRFQVLEEPREYVFAFECPTLTPPVTPVTVIVIVKPPVPRLTILSPENNAQVSVDPTSFTTSVLSLSILADRLSEKIPTILQWSLDDGVDHGALRDDATYTKTSFSKMIAIPINNRQLDKAVHVSVSIVSPNADGSRKLLAPVQRLTITPKGSLLVIRSPQNLSDVPAEPTSATTAVVRVSVYAERLPLGTTKVLQWKVANQPPRGVATSSGTSLSKDFTVPIVTAPIEMSEVDKPLKITVLLSKIEPNGALTLLASRDISVTPRGSLLTIHTPKPGALVPVPKKDLGSSVVSVQVAAERFSFGAKKILKWSLNNGVENIAKIFTDTNYSTTLSVPVPDSEVGKSAVVRVRVYQQDSQGEWTISKEETVEFTTQDAEGARLNILSPTPAALMYRRGSEPVTFLASVEADRLPVGQKRLIWTTSDALGEHVVAVISERSIRKTGIPITLAPPVTRDAINGRQSSTSPATSSATNGLHSSTFRMKIVDAAGTTLAENSVDVVIASSFVLQEDYSASVVQMTRSTIQPVLRTGGRLDIQLTVKNSGKVRWSPWQQNIFLTPHPLNSQDNAAWGVGESMPLNSIVNPGQTTKFSIRAIAPTTPKIYNLQWRMAWKDLSRNPPAFIPFGNVIAIKAVRSR